MERLQSHFGMADTNSDGAVSRAEFKAYRAKQWSRLDRNGDGFLSQDDLPGFLQSRWNGDRAAAMRRDYDQNRDGRISHDEYVNGPAPAFDRADSDANNLVTRAEMDAAAKRELRQ
ncbi:EF-hand domain-containing protein [Sphingopyxis sp.]|uniref:EF-hand domain-containing protein n=1 Tax=Sphingopyxis sp. TaxID=1908224 RepID=UPI0035B06FF0